MLNTEKRHVQANELSMKARVDGGKAHHTAYEEFPCFVTLCARQK